MKRLAFAVLVLLAGPAEAKKKQPKRLELDPASIVGVQLAAPNPCGFRLKEVLDRRPLGENAGALGWNELRVEDGPGLLRSELLKAGLLPGDGAGRGVVVSLRRLYLKESQFQVVPVVVYSVEVEGMAPFVVRAHPVQHNWNSSGKQALSALSSALHDANLRLMAVLNADCKPDQPLPH